MNPGDFFDRTIGSSGRIRPDLNSELSNQDAAPIFRSCFDLVDDGPLKYVLPFDTVWARYTPLD
jgi:hypothetical protein